MYEQHQSPLTATSTAFEIPNRWWSGERCCESGADSFGVTHVPHEYEILLATGPDSARLIPLTGRKQTLGRSSTCGIRIDDPSLESHHIVVSGDALNPEIQPLGGTAEIRDSSFRVGSTMCWVQPAITSSLMNQPSLATKPFHRSPQTPDVELEPPVEPVNPPRPASSATPPWGPIGGGVATGLLVAAITGQWLFGVFSLVTAGIAGVTWGIQRHGQRRAIRRWTINVNREREKFDHRCAQFARHLATKRRNRHRTLGELFLAANSGDDSLWTKRQITDVCVGFGSRQVTVVSGARPLAFNDIPVTIDFSSGSIVGIHGSRSVLVTTAIVLRLAMEIGPSDWRLISTENLSQSWKHVQAVPHLRGTPLGREDLGEIKTLSLHDVVLVTDSHQISHRHSLPLRYLESHGASLLVCAATQRDLPASCTTIIDSTDIELDGVTPEGARNVTTALSQWHDPDARTLALPPLVRLNDFTGLRGLEPRLVRQRWSSTSSSLSVDIGMTSEGPVNIDLAVDGPHMIVVGTTGSGKSEFLRSLIISMALRHSPTSLNFILFDYKGGSAFDACAQLPHVVGIVTDLDSDEGNEKTADRAMRGLEAELRRREGILRQVGCSNHHEYQCQRRSSAETMPRLVIVVDELAALRADVPEIVSALIAVAQRGRSLGLHLVLATQRPGTELTPDVMANATIRLALRLQTREDSVQVIGHPGAAGLLRSSPGRALLRLGSETPEEFQTLYIADDLADLVAMAESVAKDMGLRRPRRPWCAPLGAHLAPPINRQRFNVGQVDDPDEQRQFPLQWNPNRHLLVMTGPSSGKTWSLYTMAAISQIDEPEALVLFISGRGDHEIGSSWIAVSDRERLQRILHFLVKTIDQRRSPQTSHDRITVFIDDVDLWRSQHTDDRLGSLLWDQFERVIVEGPSVGVTCVVTATHDHSLPVVLKARIDQRWMPGARAGSYVVSPSGSSRRLFAHLYDPQSFAENLESLVTAPNAQREALLATLSTYLDAGQRQDLGSFGKHADDFSEAILDSTSAVKFLIVGPRGSGRTTVLNAIVEAWKELHPLGMTVLAGSQHGELESFSSVDGDINLIPVLIVVDDADRQVLSPSLLLTVTKALALDDSPGRDLLHRVSVVATASPHGLRTHSEHWLQTLRRSRSGVLLGRCAEEDGDLLGHYSRHLNFVPAAVARGLWIDDGESRGVVQCYSHSSSRPDLNDFD